MNTPWLKHPSAAHQSAVLRDRDASGGIVVYTQSGTVVDILGAGQQTPLSCRPARVSLATVP